MIVEKRKTLKEKLLFLHRELKNIPVVFYLLKTKDTPCRQYDRVYVICGGNVLGYL